MAKGWWQQMRDNQKARQEARRNVYTTGDGGPATAPPSTKQTEPTPQDWWKGRPTPVKDWMQTGKPQGWWQTGQTPIKDWWQGRPTDMGGTGTYGQTPQTGDQTAQDLSRPTDLVPKTTVQDVIQDTIQDVGDYTPPTVTTPPTIQPAPTVNSYQDILNALPGQLQGLNPAYTDFLQGVMNQQFLGPEAEQAYGDALEAQIRAGYDQQKGDLIDYMNQVGTQAGAFHSGKLREYAGEELRKLGETEQREINEMREGLAYTGLQRELQRQQQGIEAAQVWGGLDVTQKGQVIDFLTSGYEAEIDKWFKQGSLDLDRFKAIVADKLGVSELELEATGQHITLMATLMDYMLQSASTEMQRDYITAQIQQIGANMQQDQLAQLVQNLTYLAETATNIFTGYT